MKLNLTQKINTIKKMKDNDKFEVVPDLGLQSFELNKNKN